MPRFVTGAGGFLGQILCERLASQGETVHAMVHEPEKHRLDGLGGVKVFHGDVEDPDSIRRAMEGCDKVYHLAALATNWVPDPGLFDRVNHIGTRNLLNVAQELGVERVVHVSSAATLGPQRNGEPVDEEHRLSLEEAETLYEKSKIKAEVEVQRKVKEERMDAVLVNPTRLYGPGPLRKSNAVTKMIRDYLRGRWRIIPGNGKGVGNYAFTLDVVEGFLLAMEHGRAGERYILGGTNIDFDGFFATLSELSGVRRWMFHLPVPVMIAISQIMKYWSDLTKSHPLITPNWVRKYMGKQWAVDLSKAQEELGYRPHSLEEGLRSTVEWLVEEREVRMEWPVEKEEKWEEG